MKVNPFITLYNSRLKHIVDPSPSQIIELIKELIKPEAYLTYDDKLKIVDRTIAETKTSPHPTADRYRYFVCNLISVYTSLECDLKGFDALSSCGLIDLVISTFEQEFKICNNLLQMCLSDLEWKVGD